MKVSMEVGDTRARLGYNGIVFHIADNEGRHVGKLRIGSATIEWCSGRTRIGNGRKVRLETFIPEVLEGM